MDLHTIPKMMIHKPTLNRFIEIDFLRGFAIIYMISVHALWDLDYFKIYPLNSTVQQTNVIIQVVFFLLVGICLSVNYNKNQGRSKKKLYFHMVRRGSWIFALGMVITIVTLLFMPDRPILFGVLHCIGLCIILSPLFLRFKHWNFVIATVMISAGIILGLFHVENPTALHLLIGLHPADFWIYTIDYFPLLLWLGVCLLGTAIGNVLYQGNERRFKFPDISKYAPIKAISWVGKHSLGIYLVHQPIIAGAITLYLLV